MYLAFCSKPQVSTPRFPNFCWRAVRMRMYLGLVNGDDATDTAARHLLQSAVRTALAAAPRLPAGSGQGSRDGPGGGTGSW
jgi:hypothetical protein